MAGVTFLLGSNLGNRNEWLRKGILALKTRIGPLKEISSVYETAAWGIEDQPEFLNIVIQIDTALLPDEVLRQIQLIEEELERQREIKWGQRTLDIDILFYDDLIIEDEHLKIPHPHLHERLFTLIPVFEILPNFKHPKLGKTISELLKETNDKLRVTNIGRMKMEKLNDA
jgi:2-amino-4-hydroxy-6-hydroxymethyldihydropteridine diphosphokinase